MKKTLFLIPFTTTLAEVVPGSASKKHSLYWITGMTGMDYPYSCKCEPLEIEKLKESSSVEWDFENESKIQCVSQPSSIIGNTKAYCQPSLEADATTGPKAFAAISGILVIVTLFFC